MTQKDNFELLSAFTDGELAREDVDQARTLGQTKAGRAALADIAAADSLAKAAFAEIGKEAIPEALIATIERSFEEKTVPAPSAWATGWRVPLAASIVVGVVGFGLAAFWLENRDRRLLEEIQAQRLNDLQTFAVAVQSALESTNNGLAVSVAGQGVGNQVEIMPTRTYQSASQHWCREFRETRKVDGVTEVRTGLACREKSGGWRRLKTVVENTMF